MGNNTLHKEVLDRLRSIPRAPNSNLSGVCASFCKVHLHHGLQSDREIGSVPFHRTAEGQNHEEIDKSELSGLALSIAFAAIFGAITGAFQGEGKPKSIGSRTGSGVSQIIAGSEPFFEHWDEGGLGLHGTLAVAMDGTVLMFGRGGGKDIHEIFLRRSEDGGATWSEPTQIGPSRLDRIHDISVTSDLLFIA